MTTSRATTTLTRTVLVDWCRAQSFTSDDHRLGGVFAPRR